MKLRKALSLTALLAGAGLGLAQEPPTDAVAAQSGKPSTFMDNFRRRAPGETAQTPAPPAPGTTLPGARPLGAAPVGSMPVMDAGAPGCLPSTGEFIAAERTRSCTFYGGAEYMLLKLGPTFRSEGVDRIPSIRSDMPFTFLGRTLYVNAPDHGQVANLPVQDGPGGPNQVITNQLIQVTGKATLSPTLFDGSNLDAGDRNAIRFTVGVYLDAAREHAIEARYFQVERHPTSFTALASGGVPFNLGTDLLEQNAPQPSGNPPVQGPRPNPIQQSGAFIADFSADIHGTSSNQLYGFEANCIKSHVTIGTVTFYGIGGLRYLYFQEAQHLEQNLRMVGGQHIVEQRFNPLTGLPDVTLDAPAPNFTSLVNDSRVQNYFYAAQAGGSFEGWIGNVFFNGRSTVAVGGMRQSVRYSESIAVSPNALTIPTSVYPQPAQLDQTRTRLTFAPEFQGNVGYAFTDNIRAFVGYDLLFIRRIVRPQDGGSSVAGLGTISLSGPTVAARGPALTNFTEENLVVHGWNFGIEVRY
jgi:hypothetical protein